MSRQILYTKNKLQLRSHLSRFSLMGGMILAGIWGVKQITATTETVSGYAFLDYNGDQTENNADSRLPVLTVNVYNDADASGTLSSGDKILASDLTDEDGDFSVQVDYTTTLITQRTASENDDVEEDTSDGSMYMSSSDLEMVHDGATHQLIGIRYESVLLAPAATIDSAKIEFKAKYTSATSVTLKIYAEKTPFSRVFADTTNNLSDRDRTTNYVTWNTGSWTSGSFYKSPELTPIINEVTSQPGWIPGNPITFIIEGTTGTQTAYSGTSVGPELQIRYALPTDNYVIAIDTNSLASGSSIQATAMTKGSATGKVVSYHGEPIACYAVSDASPDKMLMMNRISGQSATPSGGGLTGVPDIEAAAFDFGGMTLYAVDANTLGTVSLTTGVFSAKASTIGTGDGADSPITFGDIDGLAFHPYTGELWATHRRAGSTKDVLLKINKTTGQFVPDAFGAGVDYVVIDGTNVLKDVDDLAIDPSDGKFYGVNNGSGLYEFLIEINPQTGAATIIDTLNNGGERIRDMEGFGFTNFGVLMSTTGDFVNSYTGSSMYQMDLSTAQATWIGSFSSGGDFEGCDCLTGAPNTISGYVFEDANYNQTFDGGEAVFNNAKIRIYIDSDGDGVVDPGETLIDSTSSNASGYFSWKTAANINFVAELEMSSITGDYIASTSTEMAAGLSTSFGDTEDSDNDFGVIDANTFPVEYADLSAEWTGKDALVSWTTLSEENSDHFVVERSVGNGKFEALGKVAAKGFSRDNSHYSYTDSNILDPNGAPLFYRLKQIDLDGSWAYSPSVQLLMSSTVELTDLQVYPNPAREWTRVKYQMSGSDSGQLRVFDVKGQLIFSQRFGGNQGELSVHVSGWQAGLYIFRLENDKTSIQSKVLVH